MGIYADNGGLPGALMIDAGAIVTSVEVLAMTISLPGPALYWLAALFSGTPTMNQSIGNILLPFGADYAKQTIAYGALPNPFVADGPAFSTFTPVITIRKA